MSNNKIASKKITPLESMRGIAAFMVFLFHFMIGFMPQRHGQEVATAIPGGNLKDTPFFFLINGHAAVLFFFVLSGFVLSYSYFSKKDNKGLLTSIIKRWPRLFPLALISTIVSYLLIQFDLYSYSEAARITQSDWMSKFANARRGFLNADFSDAFMQGWFYTFFRGDKNLNTSLWTMYNEFYGSLVVFALIPLLNGKKALKLILPLILFLVVSYFTNIFFIAFILGCYLSYYRCQVRSPDSTYNKFLIVLGVIFVIFSFGYIEPGTGFYSFMNVFNRELTITARIILHTIASVVLIELILSIKGFYNLLDNKIGRFLGRCSFALYVIHVPLLFSFSTYVFLTLLEPFGYTLTIIVTFALTMPLLFLISWLMALIDEFWCKRINSLAKKIT